MSITSKTETLYVVVCDACDSKSKHIYEGHPSALLAWEWARQHGWDVGLVDTCPTCVHTSSHHWRSHQDAINAAYREASRTDLVHRAYRCQRCNLWTISPRLDDE